MGIELVIRGRLCGLTVVLREPLLGRERFKQPDVSKNLVAASSVLIFFSSNLSLQMLISPFGHYTILLLRNASTLDTLLLMSQ